MSDLHNGAPRRTEKSESRGELEGAEASQTRGAPPRGPRFDLQVAPGGYLWWYLDGVSDDKQNAITLIAFVGSVFSPYYAWAGRRDPENHCAVNVALYGTRRRWTMTERGRKSIVRQPDSFAVGPSTLCWEGDTLVIALNEIAAPFPRRVKGTIRVKPRYFPQTEFKLDREGRHIWQPIAPVARISVELESPALSWAGSAYLDSNRGEEPLEEGFKEWTWSRAHDGEDCIVLYDCAHRDGSESAMALRCCANGTIEPFTPPPQSPLPATLWRIQRSSRSDEGVAARVESTLEDTPFYARSLLSSVINGRKLQTFHESLSLDRFQAPIVRAMLPFRMPRRGRR